VPDRDEFKRDQVSNFSGDQGVDAALESWTRRNSEVEEKG
jgi:hypothetical protein